MWSITKNPDFKGMFNLNKDGEFIKAGSREELTMYLSHTNSKPDEYKGQFYCLPTCTECCHQQILVTQPELFRIRRALRQLDSDEIERLANQDRDPDYCPLLDVESGRCSVYEARPDICKAFGCYTGAMACSYNLDAKLGDVQEYFNDTIMSNREMTVGRLGVDYTWDKGLARRGQQ